jgi:hypothetical protein
MKLFSGEGTPYDMQLILRHESAGYRHYLDGRAVHCGDQIELQLGGRHGPWLKVRYEANLSAEDGPAVVLLAMGGRIYYDEDASFRWPNPR